MLVDRRSDRRRRREQIAEHRIAADCRARSPRQSGDAMTIAPSDRERMPTSCRRVGASRRNTAEIATMNAGCRLTSVTDAAIVVRWIDAFHAQKCSASATPAATARTRRGA